MARAITHNHAGVEYARRHHRDWILDGWLGWYSAVGAELLRRSVVQVDQADRAAQGKRLRRSVGAVPEWFRRGLTVFRPLVLTNPTKFGGHGLLIALIPPKELLRALDGTVPTQPLPAGTTTTGVGAFADKVVRGKSALQAFCEGVYLLSERRTGAPPKASQLALLAGACGLEEFTRADAARKRWEDRVRLWSKSWSSPDRYGLSLGNASIESLDEIAATLVV